MTVKSDNEVSSRRGESIRILAVSDEVEPQLYNSAVGKFFPNIDLLISCGDLPPYYLDFLASTLGAPLIHVLGNHSFLPHEPDEEHQETGSQYGGYNLNGRVADYHGLLMAGLEGSPVYNNGPHQYTEQQIAWQLGRLIPRLLANKVRTGRYLDILVTHTPPFGIHDNADLAHRGFKSLLPFIERFKPELLLHGHTHRYDPMLPGTTKYRETKVVNVFGHALINLHRDNSDSQWRVAGAIRSEVRHG